jgi:hypothetical protein
MEEMADLLDTITYEVQCNIASSVPRIYFEDGKEAAVRKNNMI